MTVRAVPASALFIVVASFLFSSNAFAQETETIDPGIEQGLEDGEFPPVSAAYESTVRTESKEFDHTLLSTWSNLTAQDTALVVVPEPLEESCADCDIVDAKLKIELRMGQDDYTYGRSDFTGGDVVVAVEGYINNVLQQTFGPVTLSISETGPQQRQVYDFYGNKNIDEFRVSVKSYTPPTHADPLTNGNLQTDIRLQVFYEKKVDVGAVHTDPNQAATPLVKATPIGPLGSGWSRVETNPLTLSWTLEQGCAEDQFPSYQLQLLRLFNRDSLYVNATNISDGRLHDTVDWTRALTLETGSRKLSQILTIAEGTGYYVWRVRPIGDKYPGGIANDLNWGVWSVAPEQGAVIDIPDITGSASITVSTNPTVTQQRSNTLDGQAMTPLHRNAIFFYGSFDEEKNWIYNRNFGEGDADGSTGVRIGESITFATRLLRTAQVQGHVQSSDLTMLSETFYDYNGRSAVQTMASPRPWSGFRYDETFIEGFGTADFDADATLLDPNPIPNNSAVTNELTDYYALTNANTRIPDAQGFPYSRTVWYPDATGRLSEVGGVGNTHRIGGKDPNATQASHTTQYFYASAFESELIAMFGNEAPDPLSVRAVYSVDPNKVTSVSYINKQGQTLATALVKVAPTDNAYLDANLAGDATYSGESVTILDEGRRSGDSYHYTSRLMVESPGTAVSLAYTFTPESLDLRPCPTVEFCKTCDYMLYVRITNAKDPTDVAYDDSIDIYDVIESRQLDLCNAVEPVTIDIMTDGTPDNLPAIGAFSDIGSYVVDVWLQSNRRNESDPSGLKRSFVDTWSNELRDELRSSMDEGLDILYAYLDEPIPDIEGFYGHLDSLSANNLNVEEIVAEGETVAYVLKGVNGDASFPEETCWEITIPVLSCSDKPSCDPDGDNDIYDANGNLDVDYEGMLYAKWGPGGYSFVDENNVTHNFGDTPEKYFRRDGEPLYPASTAPYTNKGKGAFNAMIKEMITDGYDCESLLIAWTGLVESFGASGTKGGDGDPRELSPNFDLMETFLNIVGREYEGVSDCPYGDCGDDNNPDEEGYLKYAYQYFNYTVGSNQSCENPIIADHGPISGWNADNSADEYADLRWLRLYECVRGAQRREKVEELIDLDKTWCGDCDLEDPGNIPCALELADSITSRCRSICDWRADGFRRGIRKMYHDAGFPIEGDQTMPNGDAIPNGTTIVSFYDVECKVDMLVQRCKSDCYLSVFDDEGYQIYSENHQRPIGRFGDSTQMAKIQNVYTSSFSVALSDSGQCSDPTMELLWDYGSAENAIINAMNQKLQRYRRDVMIADTGSAESYFYFIRDSIYLGTMRQSGYYVPNRDSICTIEFWNFWPDWGNGQGVVAPHDDDNPYDRDCCPPMTMPETFTFDEALNGEFVLHEDWNSSLYYRRTCNRNGQIYMHEQLLCDDFTSCNNQTSTDEEKDVNVSARYDYNDCLCEDELCFRWDEPTIDSAVVATPVFCEEAIAAQLRADIEMQAAAIIDAEVGTFRSLYREKCVQQINGSLTITKQTNLYHFTLYYFDRVGSLVRTVPPAGVTLLAAGMTREKDSPLPLPNHTLATVYEYNSLGHLVGKLTPDGGRTSYWYDALGRLRLTQEAKDAIAGTIGYRRYDELGRIVEVGASLKPVPQQGENIIDAFIRSANDPAFPDPQDCDERIYTRVSWAYTTVNTNDPGYLHHNGEYLDGTLQRNTLNRVAHVYTDDGVHTQYSYDPHGTIEWIRQEIPGLGSNYVRYEYDNISSNVLSVNYNEGWVDQHFQRLKYNLDGRVVEVMSSRDGEIWDSDARYYFYDHGSIRRVEYGEDNLQGLDYVYTIQGWQKAINHPALWNNWNMDPGGDGGGSGVTEYAYDAFGMTLMYYSGDFTRPLFNSSGSNPYNLTPSKHLYNGNIATWTSNILPVGITPAYLNPPPPPQRAYEQLTGYKFEYDVLNRLRKGDFNKYTPGGGWTVPLGYHEQYTYDPNGNIKTLLRKGVGADAFGGAPNHSMDNLTYNYIPGTNQLSHVTDVSINQPDPGYNARYANDIDGQMPNNYQYDASGNLIIDKAEGITGTSGDVIEWTAYGKISRVVKNSGEKLRFLYDAFGNRIMKEVDPGNGALSVTYYVYEASGRVVATYKDDCTPKHLLPPDYDHDGVPDISDNCPMDWNPGQENNDAPGDLIGDACDQDDDNDNIPDVIDPCPFWIGPNCPGDKDGDGIPDWQDPCDEFKNTIPPPPLPNEDGDQYPDECDPDIDGDGRNNDHDNCPFVKNPDQADKDNDGIGDACDCTPRLSEWFIYGSAGDGRLATARPLGGIARSVPRAGQILITGLYTRIVGEKEYELCDHLGNVRVVINDRKDGILNPGRAPYHVEMLAYNNHYPFGMPQPERSWSKSTEGYRYGYQGQEVMGELWKGAVSFTYRVEDARLGRFFSLDPLSDGYPGNSPYAFAMNRVIDGVELEGAEWKPINDENGNLVDYEWVGDAGKNDDGSLKEGYVWSAQIVQSDHSVVMYYKDPVQLPKPSGVDYDPVRKVHIQITPDISDEELATWVPPMGVMTAFALMKLEWWMTSHPDRKFTGVFQFDQDEKADNVEGRGEHYLNDQDLKTFGISNPWVNYFLKKAGEEEDETIAWCASSMSVFTGGGKPDKGPISGARSWATYGTIYSQAADEGDIKLVYGGIAVFLSNPLSNSAERAMTDGSVVKIGSQKGHVGFIVGMSGNMVVVLGGNQGYGYDGITVTSYTIDSEAKGEHQLWRVVLPDGYTPQENNTKLRNLPDATHH